ncbi:hypothetical protein RHSIM_Rhsim11G0042900 [Rhododendron simsii]|uniref:Uncharacterized protein n=1 Tax=Rhododendron simsii TaxID=118357 RepID=A0A834LBJ4_RHOSS|nr:hypothetical protein RHSIM_Rhsim11G0042900 [Rhododendron simsii]
MKMHPSKLVQALHIGDSHGEGTVRRAHLHRSLWFIDYVLRNLCPQGHKDSRRKNFLRCLYSFHIGAPINAPEVMFLEFEHFKKDMKKETEIPFPHVVAKLITLADVDKQPPYKIPRSEERDDDVVTFFLDACVGVCAVLRTFCKTSPLWLSLLLPWLKSPRLLAVYPIISRGACS